METSTPRLRARWPELLGLLALQLLAFHRPLFTGTFFFRDLHLLFFFERCHVAEQLAAGHLPLWEPLLNGGRALLPNVNFTALYPSNLLYLLLPHVTAFNLEIVGHFALAGLGALLLARALGLGTGPALVAAIAFELCGFSLSLANLVNRLLALPWLPFALLAWNSFLRRKRWRDLATLAAFLALQILAGFPELTILTLATLLAWSLAAPSPLAPRWRFAALALAGALALGLAAVQILPAAFLVRSSARGAGLAPESALAWSVHPARLPELVVPGFFGRTETIPNEDYWGGAREDQGFPYVLSLYFGVPLLLFALLGATDGTDAVLTPRLRGVLGAVSLAAILLMLGRHLPFVPAVVTALKWRLFRYPVKLGAASLLPVALLAACGAARLRAGRVPRRVASAAWAVAALAGAAALAFLLSGAFRAGTERLFFGTTSPQADAGVLRGLLHAALASAAAALVVSLARVPRARSAAVAGGVVLIAADLLVAGASVNPVAPRELFATPPLAFAVRAELGGGKLFRAIEPPRVSPPTPELAWLARFDLLTLRQYTAAGYGIPLVYNLDFDGLLGRPMTVLNDAVWRSPWDPKLRLLAASGATLILTSETVAHPDVTLLRQVQVPGGPPLLEYRIARAATAVRAVTRWRPVASPGEALRAVASGALDPEREIAVEGAGPATAGAPEAATRLLLDTPALRAVSVACPAPSLLFVATPRDPGWTARVDGARRPILRANGVFQAVSVPPGTHVVELRYWPPGLTPGLWVSGLTLAGLLAALVLARRAVPESSSPC